MDSERPYRSFNLELKSIAGYYTGTKLGIDEAFIDNDSVYLHENIHRQIFNETMDGQLHENIIRLASKEPNRESREQLNAANEFLFYDTRVPHERAATFLGVIGLPTKAQMQTAFDKLNSEYTEYFNFFGNILPWESSSYFSYLIAWSTTRFSFGSQRMSMIKNVEDITTEKLAEAQGPTDRMNEAWDIYRYLPEEQRESIFSTAFGIVLKDLEIKPFDVLDDEQWQQRINSGSTDTFRIDQAVVALLERMLSVGTGMPMLYQTPRPDCFKIVTDQLNPREFPVDFNNLKSAPLDAAIYFAREGDQNIIRRRIFTEFPEITLDRAVLWFLENFDEKTFFVFTQIEADKDLFRLIISSPDVEGYTYAPGSGNILNLVEIAQFLEEISQLLTERNLNSPEFYIIYASSERGCGNTEVWVPIEENLTRLLINHTTGHETLSKSNGVVLKPIVYARNLWSQSLQELEGQLLVRHLTMTFPDSEIQRELSVHVLQPTDTKSFARMAVMTRASHTRYEALIEHLERDNKIASVQSEFTPEIELCISSLWETCSFL